MCVYAQIVCVLCVIIIHTAMYYFYISKCCILCIHIEIWISVYVLWVYVYMCIEVYEYIYIYAYLWLPW